MYLPCTRLVEDTFFFITDSLSFIKKMISECRNVNLSLYDKCRRIFVTRNMKWFQQSAIFSVPLYSPFLFCFYQIFRCNHLTLARRIHAHDNETISTYTYGGSLARQEIWLFKGASFQKLSETSAKLSGRYDIADTPPLFMQLTL